MKIDSQKTYLRITMWRSLRSLENASSKGMAIIWLDQLALAWTHYYYDFGKFDQFNQNMRERCLRLPEWMRRRLKDYNL